MSITTYGGGERQKLLENLISSLPIFKNGFKETVVGGQPIRYDRDAILFIIRKCWLNNIWYEFNWPNKMPGVAISETLLAIAGFDNRPIFILDGNTLDVLVADPKKILALCVDWTSNIGTRCTKVIACPKYLLERYRGESLEELRQRIELSKEISTPI